MRMGKFMLVGINGIWINELLLFIFTDIFGIYFLVSSLLAVEIALLSNFVVNEKWTFRDREKRESVWKRLGKYNVICVGGMLLNVALLYVFTVFLGLYYLLSNLLAIGIVFYWNYFVNRRFTWKYDKRTEILPLGKNPLVSIIIPTYNERENIGIIIPEIFSALKSHGIRGEVIIVDDNSPDGTGEAAGKMRAKYAMKVINREGKLGLSSAVLEGFKKAEGEIIGVMDADLSHPPGVIPALLKPIIENEADISVGSRYTKGGSIGGWPVKRRLISKGASLFAKPLTGVKDPMSGFFFFKRRVIEGKELNPSGYKIGLEIFVKTDSARIMEIPYIFSDRRFGKSKLGLKEDLAYLKHLIKLYWYRVNR